MSSCGWSDGFGRKCVMSHHGPGQPHQVDYGKLSCACGRAATEPYGPTTREGKEPLVLCEACETVHLLPCKYCGTPTKDRDNHGLSLRCFWPPTVPACKACKQERVKLLFGFCEEHTLKGKAPA